MVGSDFTKKHIKPFHDRGVDTSGIEVRDGKTFTWAAEYEAQLKKEKLASKFQNTLILAAKVTPQEEKLLKEETDKVFASDKEAAKKLSSDADTAQAALQLAAIQVKAQDLLKSYSDKINGENKIKLFYKD